MKRAALIVGTFNPITNAHLNLGHLAKKHLPDADIIYVPAKDSFLAGWKGMDSELILNQEERYRLVKEAVEPMRFRVSDCEISGESDGRTINTVNCLKEKFGYEEIYLCMGTDKVGELEKWYKAEELVSENKFMIVERGEDSLEDVMTDFTKKYGSKFITVHSCEGYKDISSTIIRDYCRKNDMDGIRDMVPDNVYNYLKNNKEVYR